MLGQGPSATGGRTPPSVRCPVAPPGREPRDRLDHVPAQSRRENATSARIRRSRQTSVVVHNCGNSPQVAKRGRAEDLPSTLLRRAILLLLNGMPCKFAIAEGFTGDDIPCPSRNDPARNRHRTGRARAKGAVGVILINPRCTGHQVWNKQRKDEVLIDVGLGHETNAMEHSSCDLALGRHPRSPRSTGGDPRIVDDCSSPAMPLPWQYKGSHLRPHQLLNEPAAYGCPRSAWSSTGSRRRASSRGVPASAGHRAPSATPPVGLVALTVSRIARARRTQHALPGVASASP